MAQLRRLKALQISRLKAPGLYHDGGGLYLQITVNGKSRDSEPAKSWVYRFMLRGDAREMGLGSFRDVSLADARDKADLCRRQRSAGIDPIEARRSAETQRAIETAGAVSFVSCAQQYIAAHMASWRNRKHVKQWGSTLERYVYPLIGGLPARAVDTGLVLKVLEPIWTTKPETAARLRGRLESILDWAQARGYRQHENPARWRGHLDKLLPSHSKVQRIRHHPALPHAEIGDFMRDLRQQEGTAARALEFAIVTATRSGETIGARWSEIRFAERLWVILPERTKGHKEHSVPLSAAALAIIERMKPLRSGDYLFPGTRVGKPLCNGALLTALKNMGRDDLTVHGFRSSFRTWCAERTAFPREVCEAALAHIIGSDVERAYQRSTLLEKRRQLMTAWAAYCATPQRKPADRSTIASICR